MTIEHAGPYVESAVFSGHRAWIAFALYNAANDDGECWPSYETIATTARCDRSTAIRQTEWLSDHGVVEILKGDERPADVARVCGRANVFRVNLKFAWALGALARKVKDAVGRRAKDRNHAVGLMAKWAEKVVEEEGAAVLVEAVETIIRSGDYEALLKDLKGGGAPLLQKYKGGAAPPSRVAKEGEINHLESHLAPPKPSIEPSGEPSGPAAEEKSGEKEGDADGPEPVPKDLRWRARDLIIRWALDGDVDRVKAWFLKSGRPPETPGLTALADFPIPGFDFDGPEARAFIGRIPVTVRREVAGAVAWVRRWIAGEDPNEPAPPFKPLEDSLRQWPESASRDARLQWLIESVARDKDQQTEESEAA